MQIAISTCVDKVVVERKHMLQNIMLAKNFKTKALGLHTHNTYIQLLTMGNIATVLEQMSPHFWGAYGIGLGMGLSACGAAWCAIYHATIPLYE